MAHWLFAVIVLRAAVAHADPPEVVATLKGAFDDTFALDGAGGRLAVVAGGELQVIDLAAPETPRWRFPIADRPTELAFAGDAVLAIGRTGRQAEAYLVEQGKLVRRFGPTGDLRATGDGAIGALDAGHKITITSLSTGAVLGRHAVVMDDGGTARTMIGGKQLTVLYPRAGYSQLVVRKPGGYDKQKDRQLPESEAVYDVVAGKIVAESAPKDLLNHARILEARRAAAGAESFAALNGDQVEVITGDTRKAVVPVAGYDPGSLQQEVAASGAVYFSLTTDPLPDGATHRVPEMLDVFSAAGRVARIPTNGAPMVWHVAAGRLAVLAKYKGAGRGGGEITVYALPRD